MTEEEKKATNRLNHINDFRTVYLQKGCQTMNDIETVVNLIKKQQEEIEDLKWKNKIYVKSIKSHKLEIEKKDKIIKLMAKWINHHTRYYDDDGCYCELINTICNDDIVCEHCIKQYFENKVEGSK